MHDPRSSPVLPVRDIDVLRTIGEGQELSQGQVHRAVFPTVSEVVVSRRVRRLRDLGLIAVERWRKVGINRLRLTPRGRDLLLDTGAAEEDDIFLLASPLADKAIPHTLWVNDVRIVLKSLSSPGDAVLASWMIERRFVPRWAAIPDVLWIAAPHDDSPGSFLAVEVDLGTEPIKGVLASTLATLQERLTSLAVGAPTAILVLTVGERRSGAIRAAVQDLPPSIRDLPPSIRIEVQTLPREVGRPAFDALARLFSPSLKTPSGPGVV